MEVKILKEAGYDEAILGLSLSYSKPVDERMYIVAEKLAPRGNGHNKFLESIVAWIDVTAPLDWWAEMDTYRVGMTKQSSSTMHTLGRRRLVHSDFEEEIPHTYLSYLNSCIDGKAPLSLLKKLLPCGFLQRRILCTNYKTLQNIINQRTGHKLPQWGIFLEGLKDLEHYNLIERQE